MNERALHVSIIYVSKFSVILLRWLKIWAVVVRHELHGADFIEKVRKPRWGVEGRDCCILLLILQDVNEQ